jgi:hypothetical protein
LTSKTSVRSGDANAPKFDRWASPQSCTRSADCGVGARSAAMIAAAPRKKANGDVAMRAWRIGTRSGTRVRAWAASRASGSARSAGGTQSPWLRRGAAARAALPRAARSA